MVSNKIRFFTISGVSLITIITIVLILANNSVSFKSNDQYSADNSPITQLQDGIPVTIQQGDQLLLIDESQFMTIESISERNVTIIIEQQTLTVQKNSPQLIDLNDNGIYDILVHIQQTTRENTTIYMRVIDPTIPQGFSQAQTATRLIEAWNNTALLVTMTDFESQHFQDKICWEFSDFTNVQVYKTRDETQTIVAEGTIRIREYINTHSPGLRPGDYSLSLASIGHTTQFSFDTVVDKHAQRFEDTKGRVFEILPAGSCIIDD